MNPWEQEGTHPGEWAFGGGTTNGNENTWEHQQENGTGGGAVSPSQKHDGEISPGKNHSLPTKVQEDTELPPVSTPRNDKYSGFKMALARLGEKIFVPTSVERELGWQKPHLRRTPKKDANFETRSSNSNISGRLPS